MRDEFFTDEPVAVDVIRAGPLTLLPSVARKSQFDELAASLNQALLEENSALEAYVRIKNVAEVLDVALSQLKEQALSRLSGASEQVFGVTVQLKSLPKKWEYDDAELRSLEAEKAAVEAKAKVRKKFLENLKTEMADAKTGELIRPARCISDGVTIQVTF
jgi:hypothetical protein